MKKGNNSLHKSDSKTKVSIKTNSNTKKNINNSISEDELKILGKQFNNLKIKEAKEKAKERNEKIRQHYLKKKQERNAETKRLLEEYQRLSNLGAFN